MSIKELRARTGLSQSKFAKRFQIPVSTLQHWEQGHQKAPVYVVAMIERILTLEESISQSANLPEPPTNTKQ